MLPSNPIRSDPQLQKSQVMICSSNERVALFFRFAATLIAAAATAAVSPVSAQSAAPTVDCVAPSEVLACVETGVRERPPEFGRHRYVSFVVPNRWSGVQFSHPAPIKTDKIRPLSPFPLRRACGRRRRLLYSGSRLQRCLLLAFDRDQHAMTQSDHRWAMRVNPC